MDVVLRTDSFTNIFRPVQSLSKSARCKKQPLQFPAVCFCALYVIFGSVYLNSVVNFARACDLNFYASCQLDSPLRSLSLVLGVSVVAAPSLILLSPRLV